MDNIEKLKNEGIYQEGDAFIYGNCLPSLWQVAVYGGALATLVGLTNFVIIKKSEGITIIPCNKVTNAVILDKKIFIPSNEIAYFKVEKGNLGFYKISIMGQGKCLFLFQISKNVTQHVRKNLDLLFNNFECKNRELIKKPNKIFVGICIFITLVFAALGLVVGIMEGDFFIVLCGTVFFIGVIYFSIKTIKRNKL